MTVEELQQVFKEAEKTKSKIYIKRKDSDGLYEIDALGLQMMFETLDWYVWYQDIDIHNVTKIDNIAHALLDQ